MINKNSGNALFLILIAVALFAALSYAVTQSGRGGGDTDKEKATILAAQITQYGASIHSAVQRMVLTGTSATALEFCTTGNVTGICALDTGGALFRLCETGTNCLFAPEGGDVTPQAVPSGAHPSSLYSTYQYLEAGAGTTINGVGTAAADVILVIQNGTTSAICDAINKGLGLAYNPVNSDSNGLDTDFDAYPGEPFACYHANILGSDYYFYYHTLVER